MRTTLTVDDELIASLRELAHRSNRPFKDVVNETLRNGLGLVGPTKAETFRVEPMSLGLRTEYEGRMNQLADEIEIEEFLKKRARIEGQDG